MQMNACRGNLEYGKCLLTGFTWSGNVRESQGISGNVREAFNGQGKTALLFSMSGKGFHF